MSDARRGRGADPPGERLGAGPVPSVLLAAAAVWGALALLCAGSLITSVVHLADDPWGRLATLPAQALILYGIAWHALREVRHAAWLDGTVLYVRGPFRVRCCDLATARDLRIRRSSLRSRHAGAVPVLVARGDDDGRSVRYPLVASDGQALPYDDRVRVADAIEAGVLSLDSRAVARELRKPNYLDIDRF